MDDLFFLKLKKRRRTNRFVRRFSFAMSLSVFCLFFLICFMLFSSSFSLLKKDFWGVIFGTEWFPHEMKFGLFNFIWGSVYTTLLALVISVPISLFTAILISEYMPNKIAMNTKLIFDVLSGVSPVVYGFWGVMVIVPIVRKYIQPFLEDNFPINIFLSDNKSGFNVFSSSIVLAVMVSPLMVSISEEVLRAIPFEIRQATMSLGCTKWEMVKKVLLRKSASGIVAATILSFSRTVGETMAVLMVAGCQMSKMPKSLFDPAYPLPALIANTFGETMSIPLYKSAIFLAAFILLILTLASNLLGWSILLKVEEEKS
ncbi:MAG: phosphate ABC transporter permease subunit PstC [Acidobacteria bacterium]|nr:phosphate ABC transporter permease subunit PstC [Acidobacteriota bacterium]